LQKLISKRKKKKFEKYDEKMYCVGLCGVNHILLIIFLFLVGAILFVEGGIRLLSLS
jgi:hypothetical protein